MLVLLLLFGSCGPERIVDTYHYYDAYDRQARSFNQVVACYPELRRNPFISNVRAYRFDTESIQVRAIEDGSNKEFFAVILPNLGGFDCHDDIHSGMLTKTEYKRYCDSLNIEVLLSVNR